MPAPSPVRSRRRLPLALAAALVGAGCSGVTGGPVSIGPEPTAAPPATPAASAAGPSATAGASAELLSPAAVYPVDNAPISIAARDGMVWALGDGVLLRIDAATDVVTEFAIPVGAGSGSIGASTDALWIADWLGDVVLRVDPTNGTTLATIPVDAPVGVIATAEGIFVGSEGNAGVVRIDPGTNNVTKTYPHRGGFGYGDGSLWFAQRETATVVRVGAATREVEGTFEVPAEARPGNDAGHGGCFVGGKLPDAWWTWCYLEHGPSVPVRIDPETLAATGSARVGGAVSGGVQVVNDLSWFVLEDRLVAVDGHNEIRRVIGLGDGFAADNAVFDGGSMWIPDEAGRRVVRIELGAGQ